MSQEVVNFDMNNAISLEYSSSDVKEEFQDEYYPDNKEYGSETTTTDTISNNKSELNAYIKNDQITKYESVFLNHIKTDLTPPEVNDMVTNNVKIEENEVCVSETSITDTINISNSELNEYIKTDFSSEVNDTVSDHVEMRDSGICPADMQIEFCNNLLVCNHCHEAYQDYCTKCRVLVHILNKRPSHNTYDRARELPKYMLETRESTGHLGIFCLKVIPEDVRFGPFTGLNSTALPLRIKEGRFAVSDDKLEQLNWMQYINPAKNIYEQNLLPFQYEDKLYYCSTRRIQHGEELLVYFGKEYEDNLLKNVEMDFVPIAKKDVENVFACVFCCLGFRSKEFLAEHKTVSHNETKEMLSVEELTQCPFCKIYLEAKEYFDHHMDNCGETNDRYCALSSTEVHELEVERRSGETHEAKKRKRGIYKCTQCKFSTMYSADFRHHTNAHYEVKMHKCGFCHRRYKAKEPLRAHVEKNHRNSDGSGIQRNATCDYLKAKNIKERSPHDEKLCHSSKYKFQAKDKCQLKSQIKMRRKYNCANCEFKTYYRRNLERHTKIKHRMESNYKCSECEFEANYKSSLVRHKNAKHLKTSNYNCIECEFKTFYKSNLDKHIRTKHLKQKNYKCTDCKYMTGRKSDLETHIKRKHLKQKDYKCTECGYETSRKSDLEKHVKSKHLKQNDYKCAECEYVTNYKGHFTKHINAKHLKQKDYKCVKCEYKTYYKSNLQMHIEAKHLKENDYKCRECEFKTNYRSNLQGHIEAKHLKQKDYKCTECEYMANRNSNLQVHIKARHPKNVNKFTECEYQTNFELGLKAEHLRKNHYKCAECEYMINSKSNLQNHIKAKHLKQKDYKCMECDFKTTYRSSLKTHIEAKHLKQKEYKCADCEYMTIRKSTLQVHIVAKHLKQNDYACAECEFKTNYKASLETHIKTKHLKQKDYKCMECEYKTNYTKDLRKHIKAKHLKENDYKCTECEYTTNYKSNLEKHLKEKHQEVHVKTETF